MEINHFDANGWLELSNKQAQSYAKNFKSAKEMQDHVSGIFNFCADNNIEFLTLLFRHAETLRRFMISEGADKKNGEIASKFFMKVFILLLDNLNYCQFIDQKYYPKEHEIKSSREDLFDKVADELIDDFKKVDKLIDNHKKHVKK